MGLEPVFRKLSNHVAELHYLWNLYLEVFGGDKEQMALLNNSGAHFFYLTQRLILENVALTFSKLTDPNRQGQNENLSLKQIHVFASENQETDLLEKVKPIFSEIEKQVYKFRELRNKKIAHLDLEHELEISDSPLEGISKSYVEESLRLLRTYMNTVQHHYFNCETAYQHQVTPIGSGGKTLIRVLRKGLQQ